MRAENKENIYEYSVQYKRHNNQLINALYTMT